MPVRLFNSMVTYMTPCTTLIRSDVVRRLGGFRADGCRFGEDSWLWLRVLFGSPVYYHLIPPVALHREAAGLSGNCTGPRPIEPYLLVPELLGDVCPPELRPLLTSFFAARACKTACMLSYWGDWRRARSLRGQFVSVRDWRVPLFWAALAGSTPLGAMAGYLYRKFRS